MIDLKERNTVPERIRTSEKSLVNIEVTVPLKAVNGQVYNKPVITFNKNLLDETPSITFYGSDGTLAFPTYTVNHNNKEMEIQVFEYTTAVKFNCRVTDNKNLSVVELVEQLKQGIKVYER